MFALVIILFLFFSLIFHFFYEASISAEAPAILCPFLRIFHAHLSKP